MYKPSYPVAPVIYATLGFPAGLIDLTSDGTNLFGH